MPIMRKVIFQCPKCGFIKVETLGDVIFPNDLNKKCPICGEKMKIVNVSKFVDVINIILNIFKGKK